MILLDTCLRLLYFCLPTEARKITKDRVCRIDHHHLFFSGQVTVWRSRSFTNILTAITPGQMSWIPRNRSVLSVKTGPWVATVGAKGTGCWERSPCGKLSTSTAAMAGGSRLAPRCPIASVTTSILITFYLYKLHASLGSSLLLSSRLPSPFLINWSFEC